MLHFQTWIHLYIWLYDIICVFNRIESIWLIEIGMISFHSLTQSTQVKALPACEATARGLCCAIMCCKQQANRAIYVHDIPWMKRVLEKMHHSWPLLYVRETMPQDKLIDVRVNHTVKLFSKFTRSLKYLQLGSQEAEPSSSTAQVCIWARPRRATLCPGTEHPVVVAFEGRISMHRTWMYMKPRLHLQVNLGPFHLIAYHIIYDYVCILQYTNCITCNIIGCF